ncbi:hypothetical protein HZH66_005988 [Vespula vulgaris]|uniref:Uncharacterized protein n=1 Tax=Vespula vulgaris TaxID=7454 RepID=A0A834NAB3_VESVU|nr:hypothetical protein HZH66_005988 [Vespula vulgaris]
MFNVGPSSEVVGSTVNFTTCLPSRALDAIERTRGKSDGGEVEVEVVVKEEEEEEGKEEEEKKRESSSRWNEETTNEEEATRRRGSDVTTGWSTSGVSGKRDDTLRGCCTVARA